jgi:hypothetical protein
MVRLVSVGAEGVQQLLSQRIAQTRRAGAYALVGPVRDIVDLAARRGEAQRPASVDADAARSGYSRAGYVVAASC